MMNFLQLGLSGVLAGALVALMALGIALIYRTTGVLNLSHGALAGIGVYIMYTTVAHVPLVAALMIGMAATAFLGGMIATLIGGRLIQGSPVIAVVATLALGVVLEQLTEQIWGATPLFFPNGLGIVPVRLGTIALSRVQVWGFGTTVVLAAMLYAFLRFTRIGLAMRAVADDSEAARLSGISAPWIRLLSWALAAALAAIAGFFIASANGIVIPEFMEQYLIAALLASVVGGLDNLPGVALGALAISVVESLFNGYAPTITIATRSVVLSAYTNTFLFIILIVVLTVSPRGLFSRGFARRV
jgi:branched-chain amino acid transport system permease protein